MFDGMGDVLEGIAGSYLAVLAVYFLLSYLITREGRGVLMKDGGMTRVYYLQIGLTWMFAGVAGAYAALYFFPEMPMSAVTIAAVAAMFSLVLVRVRSKVPHQQTVGDTILLLLCLLVGFGVPAFLHIRQGL